MPPIAVQEQTQRTVHRPNKLYDRVFFSSMTLVLLASVLFGFSKTYFMAGMVRAPLPNALIHIHGAAFTLWMILLLVQNALVATGNIRIHRTLGLGGFGLALAMLVLGLLAAVDSLRRGTAPLGLDAKTFFVIPVSDVLFFAAVTALAYHWRRRPELHKRLILIGTIAIADAGVARWPVVVLQQHPPLVNVVLFGYLALIVAFDLFTMRRVSKATIWGSLAFVVVFLGRVPLGFTPAWHWFATAMLGGK